MDILLGEPFTTLILLAQAPLIAGFIVLAWKDAKESATLHLFLCLAALWIGCMNACREIVKERPILRRERKVGLSVLPYVFSKLWVLGVMDLVGCVAMVWMVHQWVGLSGSRLALCMVLWLTALAGTTLGLAVSALSSSSDQAVGLVPLVVLPQILFSKAFLPDGGSAGVSRMLENVTLLGWSYDLFDHTRLLGASPAWMAWMKSILALTGLGALLFLLTALVLRAED